MRNVSNCPAPETPAATSRWTEASGTTGLSVRLIEPTKHEPVPGRLGLHSLDGRVNLGTFADSAGRVTFDTLSPGRYVVEARAVGYQQRTDTIELAAGRQWHGEVYLPQRPTNLTDECGFPLGRQP